MTQPSYKTLYPFLEGILHSYSQIFFSKNKVFALILVVVSFFDWLAGLSGLLAVITVNGAALLIGYNREYISQGYYGFNSLLVGLGLGIYYQPGTGFFMLLVFAALFTLFLTIWLENHFGKYGLPYLAWPFILGIWMVSLAARQFGTLEISQRGVYVLNDMYDYGGTFLVDVYHWIDTLPIHKSVLLYFQSLGAIFFQYHLLAGILIAIGLVIYSRIAFLLSLIGFFTAYFYYLFIGANLGELSYDYIGFNYILTSIAIGGFFFIPSRYSFLWVLLLTPIISIIITSTSTFFYNLQLSIYSLAFNIIVVLFVYAMKFRERHFSQPELVHVQQYSPEKNLYSQHNYKSRFDIKNPQVQIQLPFWGIWQVTQAHNGQLTHKGEWKHAWDFEICDDAGKTYSDEGNHPSDYYCYSQAVTAPADGIVQEIQDGIDDNKIGNINLEKNWGNTIIIKHGEKLYSKISHLKKGSFEVKKGDTVKRGTLLAKVGNSGRSPYPHLHFQMQKNPFIGSQTIDFPLSAYISQRTKGYLLETYARPLKDEIVSNITQNESLFQAFNFVPGQNLSFVYSVNDQSEQNEDWEVHADLYKNTYLYCPKTKSKAWFKTDGNVFYFTHFAGDENSLLYYFYLGTYKTALGFYKNLAIKDSYPLAVLKSSFMRFLQDFAAPFYIFMKADYTMRQIEMVDDISTSSVLLKSTARFRYSKRQSKNLDFTIFVDAGRIARFEIDTDNFKLKAVETKS